MGVFHIFKIVQMVQDCVTHHKYVNGESFDFIDI